MSFPRYPKYKESGVKWLGEVPEYWSVGPIKRVIRQVESGTSVNASDTPAAEGQYGVLKTSCVYSGSFDPDENKTVVEEDVQRVSCPLKAGTLIVSRMNTPDLIGAAGVVAQARPNLFLPDRLWQISFVAAEPRFVHYWTLSPLYRAQVQAACTGTSSSMKNLGQDQFGVFSFASPPLQEQILVSEFLDRETAKIDELVAEQQRLIELLKEKRQAVISHAVTKGLNPHAPMKPSGIEWLGDVPAHWKITVIKRFSTLQRGHDLTDAERTDGPYPVVTSGGISGTHGSFMAKGPGVVTGRYGSTGRLFYIEEDFWPHNTSLYVSDFHGNIPRFVWYSLHIVDFAAHSAKAAVPGVDRNDIHVLPVAVPPKDEQGVIVAYLEAETAKLDALTAETLRAINLLQERRIALISAAVTGQIDVRHLAEDEIAA